MKEQICLEETNQPSNGKQEKKEEKKGRIYLEKDLFECHKQYDNNNKKYKRGNTSKLQQEYNKQLPTPSKTLR